VRAAIEPSRSESLIQVTRLNGVEYWLNPHIIETIEKKPDTTITLVSGKKLVVREPPEELLAKIVEYRKRLGIGEPVVTISGARGARTGQEQE
jgi:flagellar protein FlbD